MLRLVRRGFDMTLYCAEIPNGARREIIDGINVVRGGGKYTIYNKAKEFYNKFKGDYDFIVDEINARPFLTPKFVGEKPILALFHQMIREEWFLEMPFPISYLCYYYLERKWLSYYRDIPTVTVSRSSRDDLREIGFRKVSIIPQGLSITPLSDIKEKESDPTVVFIGRLKRHKLPHHALEAFTQIKKELPNAKMWVIGDGYLRKELEKLTIKDVKFYGHLKNETKYQLLSRAHLVLVPSVREGWGLVVTESNAMGTPAVAYNVPGLRDSIIDRKTGILATQNSSDSLAHSAVSLLKDQDLLRNYSINALAFSRQFSWDKTADNFYQIINETSFSEQLGSPLALKSNFTQMNRENLTK
jgi:glycosyltransferase involved in cell wall biosynthesis